MTLTTGPWHLPEPIPGTEVDDDHETATPKAAPSVVTDATRPTGLWFRRVGVGVLAVVLLVAGALSWGNLSHAASGHLGTILPSIGDVNVAGAAFSLLLDVFILGCSLIYIGGVRDGIPVAGWRVAAHSGIAATIAANAAGAGHLIDVPWHATAAVILSVILELYARTVLREMREVRRTEQDQIALRLWLTAPGESIRTRLWMARTGEPSADVARRAADQCAAAQYALERALPGRIHRATRRQINRRMRAGSIRAEHVFTAIGWDSDDDTPRDAGAVLRSALKAVLPAAEPAPPVKRASKAGPEEGPNGETPDPNSAVDVALSLARQGYGRPRIRQSLKDRGLALSDQKINEAIAAARTERTGS